MSNTSEEQPPEQIKRPTTLYRGLHYTMSPNRDFYSNGYKTNKPMKKVIPVHHQTLLNSAGLMLAPQPGGITQTRK
ncbi:Uncharacterized protein APZ42_008721 [Daphnia magna]|uniref:Uncharacterized protein n=1 Tax=Daphnia magna TaxID=35525 RepID=A0A164EG74_9CRUS|nr:Uncharacterized protein APZ42_008721 [Daphnia magna]